MEVALLRTSQSYLFDEFPSDGQIWWIRWFDYLVSSHKGTGTAGITVYFSSISDQELDEIRKADDPGIKFKKYQKNAAINKIHVQASNIPSLTIGSAFRNGLQHSLFTFSKVTIDCDTGTSSQQPVKSSKPYHTVPSWWERNPYLFLNRFEYCLENSDDSWLCILRSGTIDYLIPCPEILRYFYCWSSEMVKIFTKGPWKINQDLAIFRKRTGPDETDKSLWHVTARNGFTLDQCKLLAPLCIDEIGYGRANEIYVNLHERSTNGGIPPIKARIPFRDGPIHLNAEGVWLQKEKGGVSKFLVFQITGHRWPYAEIKKLNCNIVNDSRIGEIRKPTNTAAPFGNTSQPGSFVDEEIADIITSDNDPNINLNKIKFTIPIPNVENITEVRLKKDMSRIYIKTPPHLEPTTCGGDLTSTGEPTSGGIEHPADFVPIVISEIERFGWLFNVLDKFKSTNDISEYRVFSPPNDGKRSVKYNGFTLWKMPYVPTLDSGALVYSSWAYFKIGSYKRPRGALLFEVNANRQKIYIIECETRINEGFRALIFKPINQSSINATISDALTYVVKKKGIIEIEPKINNIEFAKGWKHAYYYDGERESRKKAGINGDSLMKAIMEVVER